MLSPASQGRDHVPPAGHLTEVDRVRYIQELRGIADLEDCSVHVRLLIATRVRLPVMPMAPGQLRA